MFKEGNRECIDILLKSSRSILETGVPIRNETFEKRQELWNEIRANAERYKKGECGTFLKDLNAVFLSHFDASLLLLALFCFTLYSAQCFSRLGCFFSSVESV